MAKRKYQVGQDGAVDYFSQHRADNLKDAGYAQNVIGGLRAAGERYDAVQRAMRERAGRGRATGISYTDPATGKMKEFRRGGERPASRVTINGKTFTGEDVYKARGAAKQHAADYRKRSEFRDAMISLANPNDPRGQRLIKAANAWFDSGRDISDKMRADFGNVLKGRYAKITAAASGMKPGDFLSFKREQDKRVGSSGPADDASATASASAPKASAREGVVADRFGRGSRSKMYSAGAPGPTTANRTVGIDRTESRERDRLARERSSYFASGRGQRDYWQSRLLNAAQLKEADDARRMHSDLLKLMATSRKFGINLDEALVDTSSVPDSQPARQGAPSLPSDSSLTSDSFLPSDPSYWMYRGNPEAGRYRTQGEM